MAPDFSVFLIPIVAISGAFAVAIVAAVLRTREKEQLHRERMLMLEKGMEIPSELLEPREEKKPTDFRVARAWLIVLGMIMASIGVGSMIALGVRQGLGAGINGIIPLLIGVGFLIAQRLLPR